MCRAVAQIEACPPSQQDGEVSPITLRHSSFKQPQEFSEPLVCTHRSTVEGRLPIDGKPNVAGYRPNDPLDLCQHPLKQAS